MIVVKVETHIHAARAHTDNDTQGVFRIQSNIFDGAFFAKIVKGLAAD